MGIVRKDATPKQKLLGAVGLAFGLAWLGWQVADIVNFTHVQTEAGRIVEIYEARHGNLADIDAKNEVYNNALQACVWLDREDQQTYIKEQLLPNLWSAMTDSGLGSDQAVTIIEAGIEVHCPQHEDLLL